MGGVVGGYLALGAQDVLLIGRPGQVKVINERGLRLVTPAGTHVLRLAAVTSPDKVKFGAEDMVCLCMKSQNTEEALRDLRAVTQDVPVFCFQNGVSNEAMAARYFPRVYGVMVGMFATYLEHGEVTARREPPGTFVMGCYPQGKDELVEAVAAMLRNAGFQVMTTPDVMSYKWGKLMNNLANAVDAITDVRGGENDLIITAAQKELRDMLAQAGIHWKSTADLAREWPEITVTSRGRPGPDTRSSTWQSLARVAGSIETEFLNGEVVRLAQKLGQQAPVNETLLRISQEMAARREQPGKYTPARLRVLLRLKNGT